MAIWLVKNSKASLWAITLGARHLLRVRGGGIYKSSPKFKIDHPDKVHSAKMVPHILNTMFCNSKPF